uniref:Trypsin-1 n=1 Tax=Caligus rogercresseyi TaxID=217165 RepID=C1BRS9_CALRO|nr:Trypsin-1 [Caligus rogercresseyi]
MNKFLGFFSLLLGSSLALPQGGDKIVGGEVAEPNQFPYQLSMRTGGLFSHHFCGASIYDENTAITAGHCCRNLPGFAKVVAGDHSLLEQSEFEQKIKIKSYELHPNYIHKEASYDVCVLHLASPLEFNDKVKPVKMPEQGQEFEGKAVISGWGTTSSGGFSAKVLRWANVEIVPQDKCVEAYRPDAKVDETMICAAAPGKDSCQGDSGGPMVCEGDVQCGVVSWGFGCALARYPGVYSKLSETIDWIKQVA